MKTSKRRTNIYYVAPSQGVAWREGDSLGRRTARSDGEIARIIPPSRYPATM